ncbi:hypothetical protein HXA34_16915 [Salipaludibacillus agaradhaerens]|nr:hypothetical protein [Salipaludibacillus agaradhaerens]
MKGDDSQRIANSEDPMMRMLLSHQLAEGEPSGKHSSVAKNPCMSRFFRSILFDEIGSLNNLLNKGVVH